MKWIFKILFKILDYGVSSVIIIYVTQLLITCLLGISVNTYNKGYTITSQDIKNSVDKLNLLRTIKYKKRDLSKITDIIIHHTGDDKILTASELEHIGKTRFGVAHSYHLQIDTDATIQKVNWLTYVTAHCKDNNTKSIGIVINGNYNDRHLTPEQDSAIIGLCIYLIKNIPTIKNINGHNFYRKTACPGKNVNVDSLRTIIFNELKK